MNLETLRDLRLPPLEHRYDFRDVIVYALGLGYGLSTPGEADLGYIYEKNLKIVPSMCTVLGYPEFSLAAPEFGLDWLRALHAEQSFVIHAPLPTSGLIRCNIRIECVEDKGATKGAMLHIEKTLSDVGSGAPLATVRAKLLLRGDGGQGGFGIPRDPAAPIPARPADRTMEFPTAPNAAYIYRLNGDLNPLHADPVAARQAGFDKPILHGLCTFGVACRAILQAYCGGVPARLRSMFARFTAPVYPGETIVVEFHEIGADLRFRALVKERGIVVLDRGSAEIA